MALAIYLLLLVFISGMWLMDEAIMTGWRRQAAMGAIYETDKVLIIPIPDNIDRKRNWDWRVWQEWKEPQDSSSTPQ